MKNGQKSSPSTPARLLQVLLDMSHTLLGKVRDVQSIEDSFQVTQPIPPLSVAVV